MTQKNVILYKYRNEFFQLFNLFQLFFCGTKLCKLQDTVRTGKKNDLFERGWRWFEVFLFDFQVFFYFYLKSNQTCQKDVKYFSQCKILIFKD